jgi:hypothetical protein
VSPNVVPPVSGQDQASLNLPAGGQTDEDSANTDSASGVQPDCYRYRYHRCYRHHRYCRTWSNAQDFNSTKIPANSWIWFSSVFSTKKTGPMRFKMVDSRITFNDGRRVFNIRTPDTEVYLRGNRTRLAFRRQTWLLEAPPGASGNYFLNGVPVHVSHFIPGNVKNVTWTARFVGPHYEQIDWQWGAAVYTHFADIASRLRVKPTDGGDNGDPAGTPEAYKSWLIAGGTGNGGSQYTGGLGPAVKVRPCR